jgi:hypothetical protein
MLHLITKNTDPYKIKKCVSCKKNIGLNEKYFTYPLSLQQFCVVCARMQIPKIVQALYDDLKKINEEIRKSP